MAARGVSRRVFEVFVRRIPWNVEESELREYFTQFGPVKKCILPFTAEAIKLFQGRERATNDPLGNDINPLERCPICHCAISKPYTGANTETGFHKGFGWIGFATEESRNNALLKDHMLEGSQLEVKRQEKSR